MRGYLRRRSPRSWLFTIDGGRGSNGERRQRYFTIHATSKKKAHEECAQILRDHQLGILADSGGLTVKELFDKWLEHHASRISARSLERYESIARIYILPAIGHIELRALRPAHIDQFYGTALKQGASPYVIRYAHVTLHAALKYALRLQMIGRNVSEAVSPPRLPQATVRALADDELARLLRACVDDPLRVAVYLAATCGLRRGEIGALRWGGVDFDGGVLRVAEALEHRGTQFYFKSPKTPRSRRSVSIPAITLAVLRQHRTEQLKQRLVLGAAYQDVDLVVAMPGGHPVRPEWLSKAFKRLAARCGLKDVHFHCLRHTAASVMLRQNVHPRVVADALGHSGVGITLDRYSHMVPGLLGDAARKIDDALQLAMASESTK